MCAPAADARYVSDSKVYCSLFNINVINGKLSSTDPWPRWLIEQWLMTDVTAWPTGPLSALTHRHRLAENLANLRFFAVSCGLVWNLMIFKHELSCTSAIRRCSATLNAPRPRPLNRRPCLQVVQEMTAGKASSRRRGLADDVTALERRCCRVIVIIPSRHHSAPAPPAAAAVVA